MAETKCKWCPRDVSKHDNLALRVCLLKAIRDKSKKAPLSTKEQSTFLSDAGMPLDSDLETTKSKSVKHD